MTAMWFISLLAIVAVDATAGSMVAPRRSALLRVRGGADDADDADGSLDDKPLSEDEITEKLNAVPTFVVMGEVRACALTHCIHHAAARVTGMQLESRAFRRVASSP